MRLPGVGHNELRRFFLGWLTVIRVGRVVGMRFGLNEFVRLDPDKIDGDVGVLFEARLVNGTWVGDSTQPTQRLAILCPHQIATLGGSGQLVIVLMLPDSWASR